MNSSIYDADYFLHGKATGKSLYENYRWLPELTLPMAKHIVKHCGIDKNDIILDFGCARGYLVKALRQQGYFAYGYDTSRWAIENSDEEVCHHLTNIESIAFSSEARYDWIIAKDVLEHVEYVTHVITGLMNATKKGMFVVVPLSGFDTGKYIISEYEKDITHIQRWTLGSWVNMFLRPGWSVEVSYRVSGVKDNYKQYLTGNGFITCRRIGE